MSQDLIVPWHIALQDFQILQVPDVSPGADILEPGQSFIFATAQGMWE